MGNFVSIKHNPEAAAAEIARLRAELATKDARIADKLFVNERRSLNSPSIRRTTWKLSLSSAAPAEQARQHRALRC